MFKHAFTTGGALAALLLAVTTMTNVCSADENHTDVMPVAAPGTHSPGVPANVWVQRDIVPRPTSKIADQTREVLDSVMSLDGEFPLRDIEASLGDMLNVPVWFDERSLPRGKSDIGTSQIQFDGREQEVQTSLRRTLRPLGLKAIVQDEGLVITADRLALARQGIDTSRWVNVDEDVEQSLTAILEKPASVNMIEETLGIAFARIVEENSVSIRLDEATLEEIGISSDAPVSLVMKDSKLKHIIDAIMRPLNLALTVDGDSYLITSKEAAESRLLIRIYWLEGTGFGQNGMSNLIDLIQSTVESDTWDAMGGPSTMRDINNGSRRGLIIGTTYKTHKTIEAIMARLRDAQTGPDPISENVEVPYQIVSPPGPQGFGGVGGTGGGGMGGGGGMF